jgi:hypothetical protein
MRLGKRGSLQQPCRDLQYRRAVCVNEVMPRHELVRTEFYNDFLARDGLYYGLNLYVYDGDRNIGDLRIWRDRRHANFDDSDLQVLEIIKPHFCNAMKNILRIARGHRRVRRSAHVRAFLHVAQLIASTATVRFLFCASQAACARQC